MQFTALRVFLLVSAAALAGMVMGGLFGYVAGTVTPEVFILQWKPKPNEPLATAVFLGAFGGVFCGGFLGVFSITASLVHHWLKLKACK
ncbi:MAG: hypothetical protein ACKO0V_05035 [bacterium]